MMNSQEQQAFTHLDEEGRARMVDVGETRTLPTALPLPEATSPSSPRPPGSSGRAS